MRAFALLSVALLAGCAVLQPEASQAVAVSGIVAETVSASQASGAAQRRTLAAAQQSFASEPSDASRLRLATLLAALPAPHGDEMRASALLAPLAEGQPHSPYGQFAALLAGQLAARARVAREAERSVRAGAQREDALRQRLESLKSIERGILEREEQLRKKQR